MSAEGAPQREILGEDNVTHFLNQDGKIGGNHLKVNRLSLDKSKGVWTVSILKRKEFNEDWNQPETVEIPASDGDTSSLLAKYIAERLG